MSNTFIGRVVWFYPGSDDPQYGGGFDSDKPLAAIVTQDWGGNVNLAVFGHDGSQHAVTAVPFFDKAPAAQAGPYATWAD